MGSLFQVACLIRNSPSGLTYNVIEVAMVLIVDILQTICSSACISKESRWTDLGDNQSLLEVVVSCTSLIANSRSPYIQVSDFWRDPEASSPVWELTDQWKNRYQAQCQEWVRR